MFVCLLFKMICQRRELLKLAQVSWSLRGGHEDRHGGLAEEVYQARTRERLLVDTPQRLPPPLLGCTVVEDTRGLFKIHREEALKERRSLYQ